ncbi:hypothetical protein OpiT1DRAFT_05410 [Opitutaceae bacterium TAV1]|nr:hypothetical protein OpiT1DRAFT_05410 [Opitutaceae bacterium TAV1]
MPRVPLEYYQPQRTPESTVRANPGMFDAEHQALACVGGAVSQAGDVVGDFALKLQRAENDALLADTRRRIKQEYDDFTNTWKDMSASPEKWEGEWNKRFEGVVKQVEREGAGTLFREQFDTMVADMRQSTSAETKKYATARRVQNVSDKLDNEMSYCLDTGDTEGWLSALESKRRNGVISDANYEKVRMAMPEMFEQRSVNSAIEADPFAAHEALKSGAWPALKDEKRRTATNYAEAEMHKQQAAALDDFNARLLRGEAIPDDELEAAAARGVIDKTDRVKLSRDYILSKSKNPAAFLPDYNETVSRIAAYDPATAKPGERGKILAMIGGLAAATDLHADAKKMFDDKINPGSPLNSPAGKEAFQMVEMNFREGVYGKFKTVLKTRRVKETVGSGKSAREVERDAPVYDVLGQPVFETDANALAKAQARAAEIRTALTAFIRANPNLSHREYADFVIQFNDNDYAAAGSDDFEKAFQ